MTIGSELIGEVCAALGDDRSRLQDAALRLRERFPQAHFSLAFDDDVPSRIAPLGGGEGFRLYGIASGAHCLSLTSDAESASGLLVALLDEDA
jgi:hypothetical protein